MDLDCICIPLQKILPPKIFGFVFPEPPSRARSARRAAESVVFFVGGQRKPLRIESCLQTCDSIQPRSNLFYQPLINHARQRRARAPRGLGARPPRTAGIEPPRASLPSSPCLRQAGLSFFFAGGSGRVGQGGAKLSCSLITQNPPTGGFCAVIPKHEDLWDYC